MDYGNVKRNISDLEYRLRLLKCISELGVVTREQLWPFVAKLELMEYMPMCMYLDQLLHSGSVAEGEGALQGALFMTETGLAQLMMFDGKLSGIDRDRIIREAPAYLAGLREARTARGAYEQTDWGYGARLALTEGDLPTLLCLVKSQNRRFVETVVRRFRQNAPTITLRLISLCKPDAPLSRNAIDAPGEDMEAALRQTTPGKPSVSWSGGRAYAGNVCLADKETELRFSLQMGSRDNALRWIHAMENGDGDFFESMKKILIGFGL